VTRLLALATTILIVAVSAPLWAESEQDDGPLRPPLGQVDVAPLDAYGRLDAALAQAPEEHHERWWGASLTLGSGFNDNVTFAGGKATGVLTEEISEKQDYFVSESLSGWIRPLGNRETGLLARAGFSGTHYSEQADSNWLSGFGTLEAYHTFAPFRVEGGASYGHAWVGGNEFSRDLMGWITGRWKQSDCTRTNLTFEVADRMYLFDATKNEDRDGQLYLITLSQEVLVPIVAHTARFLPYAEYGWEETDGASAENSFWSVGVQVRKPLMDKVLDSFAHAAYRDRHFSDRHVRTSFTKRRRDVERSFGVGIQWFACENADVTLQWTYYSNSSSLRSFFSYDQSAITLYLTLSY